MRNFSTWSHLLAQVPLVTQDVQIIIWELFHVPLVLVKAVITLYFPLILVQSTQDMYTMLLDFL